MCKYMSYLKIWLLLSIKGDLQVEAVMHHMLERNDLIQACNQIAIRLIFSDMIVAIPVQVELYYEYNVCKLHRQPV